MRQRLLSLLAAGLLVTPSTAALVHVCHSMGSVIVGDCGCQKRHRAHSAHSPSDADQAPVRLQRQRCCDVQMVSGDAVFAGPQAGQTTVELAKLAVAPVGDAGRCSSAMSQEAALQRERAPPRTSGPPIYKRNCAFLN